ncbi:MAG: hypothetical protein K5912_04565, partial [Alphaproteobacteria bacterium]|nr:hypothetical protein [Alphaproteobacteria bacterium]
MSNDEFMGFLGDMAVYQEAKNNYKNACMMKRMYQSKAKKMGDLRTGLMAGNTATAVAGTVVSSKNKKGAESIVDMIQQCLDTIKNNEQKIGQAKIDCEKNQYEKLDEAVSYCKKLSTENMEKVSKQNKTSAIISGLNIGTGTAGTITSAFANKKEYDDKNKKLNTMANVFAGTSALASGVSTVFNAATLKSINNNLQVAISCEEALNNL